MIKHVVMWKLKEQADAGLKAAQAQQLKQRLEALNGRIPGLLHLEVGIDFVQAETSYDVVLYSELESRAALEVYQQHPEHQAVVPLVREFAASRVAVDYDA
ncbi:MAG TPA: Dabb family protein [Mariprofundaceae bacterium]|nr:Dabb family protein [Mariprofundaceae bacterium]